MGKKIVIAAAACVLIILVVVAFSLVQQETTQKYRFEKSENKSTTVLEICTAAIKKYLELFDSTTSDQSEQEATAGEMLKEYKYITNKVILNATNSGIKANAKEYEPTTAESDEQKTTTTGEAYKEYNQIPNKANDITTGIEEHKKMYESMKFQPEDDIPEENFDEHR